MFSMPGAARGTDIVGAPVNGHGAMLEWWSRVSGRPIAELLELAAAVPPGARGVIALPYLDGERAPRWNTELRAELTGLGASTGPGEITRALLEATAYGLAHIALELARHEVAVEGLVCGGTPARSPLWCSIKAAVLEVPVEVPAEPNLAAYGAALAAGTALGWWPAPGDAGPGAWPRPDMEVLHPASAPEYRAGLRRFIALGDDAERRLQRSARSPAGEARPNP
jgi:xylulokinase